MKIFVGTLHSNEGDWQRCKEAVAAQKNVDLTHYVVSGLPEKEAHNRLWNEWRQASTTHNMFVKVDADTVLAHENVLSTLKKLFESNNRLTGVQAPLHDYFTDRLIAGLNSFSNVVTFNDTVSDLYCDRGVDSNHDVVLKYKTSKLPDDLYPAGYHCFHASKRQAFHYGVHRALKNQQDTIFELKAAFKRNRDELRAWAILGTSECQKFKNGGFNYTDNSFEESFDKLTRSFDQFYESLIKDCA